MTIGTERHNKLVKSCRKGKDLLSELEFRIRGKSIDEITSTNSHAHKQTMTKKEKESGYRRSHVISKKNSVEEQICRRWQTVQSTEK